MLILYGARKYMTVKFGMIPVLLYAIYLLSLSLQHYFAGGGPVLFSF